MDVYNKDASHGHSSSISKQAEDASHGQSSSISKQAEVVIITVPFPCQSHLNQLLHLSCLISSTYNIPVHYATASTHLRQAKHRFNDTKSLLQNSQIHFHEFPTPDFHSPSPTPNSSTCRFPTHLQPSFESSIHLRHPIALLLQSISATTKKVVVIHDVLMAYAVQDVANVPNAESYIFNPTCAFSSFFDGWQMKGKPLLEKPPPKGLPSMEGCYSTEVLDLFARQSDFLKIPSGYIFNSCKSIEGIYLDLMAKDQFDKLIWSIGPLNLGENCDRRKSNTPKHKCLEWLDKQAPKSVLYVSFGTTTTMTDEEIIELAMGLEQSKQRFIWVFRDADKGDIFTGEVTEQKLPGGYEERVKEVGMVVRDWAPQVEILGHPSTGGFMSHCGWNSCLESITMGVPIAAWPMHSEQPKNAFLVTDILKVGLPVRTWEQREETVTSSTIAKVVENLIASKDREEIRKRAEELGASTRKAVEQGGVSRMELDSFIAHITRH